jgi:tetratricopeptide (TPR) repeat protein
LSDRSGHGEHGDGSGARAGAAPVRDEDRREFRRVAERLAADEALRGRVLAAETEITSRAGAEYAAYLRAGREPGLRAGPPLLAAGVCAVVFGAAGTALARATGSTLAEAAGLGVLVLVASVVTALIAHPGKALRRPARELEAVRRKEWLAALERAVRDALAGPGTEYAGSGVDGLGGAAAESAPRAAGSWAGAPGGAAAAGSAAGAARTSAGSAAGLSAGAPAGHAPGPGAGTPARPAAGTSTGSGASPGTGTPAGSASRAPAASADGATAASAAGSVAGSETGTATAVTPDGAPAEQNAPDGASAEPPETPAEQTALPGAPAEPAVATALARASAQLPLQQGSFFGRDAAISRIAGWAEEGGTRATVVVLHGPPGAGRTALAVRAAQVLAARFSGSCLVNLRGRGSDGDAGAEEPLSTRDALLHLLNRLGAPKQDLLFRDPASRDTHLRRLRRQYQEHLAALPTVLILDDAADAHQVRPLVPEDSPSLVLVTSREPLDLGPGVAAHSLAVEALGAADADALFTAAAGARPRTHADESLLRASRGLPLAVCIAGAAARRAGADGPVPPSDDGAPQDVLRYAYATLDPEAQRLFRRLVLLGRASLGTAAAAALLESDEPAAATQLAALDRAHMVEQVHNGRYRLHDMLRGFARACLESEDDAKARTAAQERLITDYAALAQAVIHRVEGASSSRSVRTVLRGASSPPGFRTLDEALRWLDEESSFITATLRHTDDVALQAVQRLVEALCDYCLLRGDLYRLGEIAELAQGLGREPVIRAVKLRTGIAARQLGQLDRARTTLSSLVNVYREGHNEAGAARALCSLGITLHHRGNLPEAATRLREALSLQQSEEQRGDRAWTLHALGAVLRDQGDLREAWELLHAARSLHEESESLHGQAWTCLQMGQVHLLLGELDQAEEQLWLSQELHKKTRDERGGAWALTQLGRARLLRGEVERAVSELNAARGWHRRHEDARGEAWTLYYLGQALEDAGRLDRAEDALSRARHMFSTMGDRYGQACARHHFGRVSRDRLAARSGSLKNSGFARQLLHEAQQDFHMAGMPHGEAWSAVELAVIDAGCGRISRAMEVLEEAREVFAGYGDTSGGSWATFLHCTLLPLASDDGVARARRTLSSLGDAAHPLARAYAERWLAGPWIDAGPDGPWPVWRLGLTPPRRARDVLGVEIRR